MPNGYIPKSENKKDVTHIDATFFILMKSFFDQPEPGFIRYFFNFFVSENFVKNVLSIFLNPS